MCTIILLRHALHHGNGNLLYKLLSMDLGFYFFIIIIFFFFLAVV